MTRPTTLLVTGLLLAAFLPIAAAADDPPYNPCPVGCDFWYYSPIEMFPECPPETPDCAPEEQGKLVFFEAVATGWVDVPMVHCTPVEGIIVHVEEGPGGCVIVFWHPDPEPHYCDAAIIAVATGVVTGHVVGKIVPDDC